MKVAVEQGKWDKGRWRAHRTLVRRHTVDDGTLDGINIPWVWLDGMYPVTVTIEGNFVGTVKLIASCRKPDLPGEEYGRLTDPTTFTEELGEHFPQVGQDITHPILVTIVNPIGWLGLYLASPLVSGEMSAFVLVSSMAEGG